MTDRAPIIVGDGTVLIPLTRGLFATIDEADLPLVVGRKWHAVPRSDKTGYYAKASGTQLMHRLLLGLAKGALGDHRDGDGLNNRRRNLRIATHAQNSRNRRIGSDPAKRGFRKINGRFYARIRDGKNQIALGGFATTEEANEAYRKAALAIHGEWASPDLAPAV